MPNHLSLEGPDDVKESSLRERTRGEAYLGGLVDFIKWTSTISLAAVAWVAEAASEASGVSQRVSVAALVVLLFSIGVAVLAVKNVLAAWARQWEVAQASHILREVETFWAGMLEDDFLQRRKKEALDGLAEALGNSKKYDRPAFFNRLIVCHISLSALGIAIYVIALILPAFCDR